MWEGTVVRGSLWLPIQHPVVVPFAQFWSRYAFTCSSVKWGEMLASPEGHLKDDVPCTRKKGSGKQAKLQMKVTYLRISEHRRMVPVYSLSYLVVICKRINFTSSIKKHLVLPTFCTLKKITCLCYKGGENCGLIQLDRCTLYWAY